MTGGVVRNFKMPLDNYVNQKYIRPSPCPPKGTLRGRHGTLARVAMDAVASGASAPGETFTAYGEVVWSWRRDPGVKPRGKSHAGDGGKRGRSPGRARISRKAIARGKPGCPGCTCGLTRVHFGSTPTHMGLRAQSAPGFPCALFSKRGTTRSHH